MNLKDFESHINPTILQRGKAYYSDDAIEELVETEPGFWQAWVEGTDVYDIEIELAGDEVASWNCTCPYNYGPVCKHVVATLLAIRQQKTASSTKKRNRKPSKKQQLERVLDSLDRNELVDYVREMVNAERRTLDSFLLRFQHYTGNTEPLDKRYRALFDKIIRNYSSHGFIDYRAANGFSHEVDELLDNLLAVSNPAREQVASCFVIIQGLIDMVDGIDDSDGHMGSIMYQISQILAAAYPQLSSDEQQQCFQEALELQYDSELSNYGLDDDIARLTSEWSANRPDYQALYLPVLDRCIARPKSDWMKDSLLREKYSLLNSWYRPIEADALARQHMDIPEFRKHFVLKALGNGDTTQAKVLIEEGIKLAEQKRHPGIVTQWREMLLDIARESQDLPAIREELFRLMESSRFGLKLYCQLKETYPPMEWEDTRHDVYRQIEAKGAYASALAAILNEENELEALFALIRGQQFGAVSLFKQYANRLVAEFPEETVATYVHIIQRAMKSTGRRIYEEAVKDMKTLSAMPGGKIAMQNLLKEFRLQYRNRKAMLEIFERAFGKK